MRIKMVWEQAVEVQSFCGTSGRIWSVALKEYRNFELCAVPVRSSDGAIREWVGTIIDVTVQKRVQREIQENEKKLGLIYDTVGDILFKIRVEPGDCFRFSSVNRAFMNATGLRVGQIVDKRIEDVLPESSALSAL